MIYHVADPENLCRTPAASLFSAGVLPPFSICSSFLSSISLFPLSSLSVSLFLLSSLFILFACQSLSLSSTLSVCLSGTSFTIVVSYALFLSVSDMFVFLFVCLTLSRKSYNRAAEHTYLLWRLRFASLSVRRNPVLFRVVRKSRTQRNIAFVAQKQSASVSSIK